MTLAAISPDDDISLGILKGWLVEQGYTSETVKILRNGKSIWAETRKSTQT